MSKSVLHEAAIRAFQIFKIRRAIQNLEKIPAHHQRSVYESLIKFVKLHPIKVRLGVYAPVEESIEAGDGWGECPEPMRADSCEVLNGAPDWT